MKTQVSSRSTNQFEFQSSLDSLLPDLPSDLQRRISQRSQDLSFTPQTASLANSRNAAPMRKIAAGKLPSKLKFVPKSQGRFLRRTIIGTPNRDFLPGTNASDFIAGLAGNDIILAQGGNDFILAGSGDDVAFGQGGNDTFFQGSGRFADGSGNDFLIGGDGLDTADYSQLGQAITLMPEGTILKGRAGTDVLFQVESVIGARGQANAIDAATAGGSTSIDVDLGSDRLTVNGVPGIGSLNLTVKNFVNVTGTQQSDTITGDEQDNTFFGSTGDDNFNGGEGFDTVDYSDLGEGVSLKSQGVISKGTAGTDQIQNIESIIGAVGETNIIDGRAPGDGPVSFDIDLSENRLTTKGIPFLGDVDFTVENFSQVYGTGNDDTIAGDDQDNAFFGSTGDDTFYGSRGDDTFNGDEDSDTVDYSDLGQGVTLKSQGVISKGNAGTDQIQNVETIIGAVGETNIIDGRAPGDGPVSFDIDLSENRLTTKGIPFLGDVDFTVKNFSQVYGTGNDDSITGDDQDNAFFGSTGDDSFNGGEGFDTVDYSDLGEGVSLKSQGVISKGAAGTDQIQNIESIIGAVGETNIIDGRAPGDGPVSFDIDLSENRLTTKGIPFLGDVDFTVENFSQVYGTGNDDTIAGDDQDNAFFGSTGDDTFYGSRGDDTFNGDEDSDTVDYSDLGQGVTLKSQGVISKGTAGTDQIENIESIIGAVGETNIIDGRAPGDGPVSFDIDLSENRLTTKGIPVVGDVQFNVENFSQIYGTGNDDAITGDNQRNRLFGGSGNDRLSGLGGNDVMRGGSGSDVLNGGAGRDNLGGGRGDDSLQGGRGNDVLNGTGGGRNAGRNEVDTLTGGSAFAFAQSSDKLITALKQSSLSGFRNLKQLEALQKSDALSPSSEVSLAPNFQDQDRFILGNSRSVFYQGDAAFGLTDYAYITDFQSGADTIQLNGRLDDYFLLGSSLIFQDNGSKGLDAKDDLVGVVGGSGFNLSGSDFRFVA